MKFHPRRLICFVVVLVLATLAPRTHAQSVTNAYSTARVVTNVVPAGMNALVVKLWGAGGGNSGIGPVGGGGAFVRVVIPVKPGESYVSVVGQRGASSSTNLGGAGSGNTMGGAPGYFGDYNERGQGGQASSFFLLTNGLFVTKAIAGAGGGAGRSANGGAAGFNGEDGGNAFGGQAGADGIGGAGGGGANYNTAAVAPGIASLNLAGGHGGNGGNWSGGGGGGYGGGGGAGGGSSGAGAGGGGGGSFGTQITRGNGSFAGNNGDPDYAGTAGNSGNDGRVVLAFYSNFPPAVATLPANGLQAHSARLNGTATGNAGATRWWFNHGVTTNYGQNTATNLLPPSGTALRFNGSNQWAMTSKSLNFSNRSFTVEAWARRAGTNRWDWLFQQGSNGVNNLALHFGFRTSDTFSFAFWGNDLDTTNTYTDTNWHHWAGTFDATTLARAIYRDGVMVASNLAATVYQGTGSLTLARSIGTSSSFGGDIAGIQFWSGVRTLAQITNSMESIVTGFESNLLACWRFNEGSGNTVVDATTNANHGALTNSPPWIAPAIHPQTVTGLLASTAYNFRIGARDLAGIAFGSNRVFTTAPPAVITLPPSSVVATGATFNASVNPGNAATIVFFDYGTTTNYGFSTTPGNVPATNAHVPFSTAAGLLTPGTLYHYRASASNSAGIVRGENVPFITPALPPVTTTAPATNVALFSATLRGSVNPNGEGTRYYFEYGTTTNFGTVTATNVLPPSGVALRFDGSSQSVTTSNSINLSNVSFTVEAWARRTTSNRVDFLFQHGSNQTPNGALTFGFRLTNTFTFAFWNNDLDAPATYSDTDWHHWAGTFDAATRVRTLYRDGVVVASDVSPVVYQANSTFMLARSIPAAAWFAGDLDEVRIWSGARSQSQIVGGMTTNAIGNESGLLACWRLNEGSGNFTADSSPNAHGGTLVNSPTWLVATNLAQDLNGLTAGTTYFFRLVAVSDSGTTFGSNFSFTTPPMPVPSVTTLSASNITLSSARLNGTVNPNNGGPNTAFFELGSSTDYGRVSASTNLVITNAILPINTVVSNLLPGTTYRHRAVATNSASGSSGADVAFTTAVSAPIVQTQPASGVSGTSATFQSAVAANGLSTRYHFQYGGTTNYGLSTETNLLPPSASALRFNGVNQRVSTSGSMNLSNVSFTVEAWARRTGSNRYDFFFQQGGSANVNASLHFGFRNNNAFTFGFWGNDLDTPGAYTDTDWHHWAGTYEAATRIRAIYRDGVLVVSNTAPSTYQGIGVINIASTPGVPSWFAGDLDEVRFWSGARSPAEIASGMNTNASGFEPGLLACWRFDEGINTFTADSSANLNHGTLVNAPAWISPAALPANISGLLPGFDYHFRVVSMNSLGTTFGSNLVFSTPAIVPSVSTLAPGSFSATGAVLNASVNPNGADTTVWFQYAPSTNFGIATISVMLARTNGTLPVSSALGGLNPGTLYYYRAIASNSAGMVFGSSASFWTSPQVPLALTQSATNVTSTTATLSGGSIPSGRRTHYYFEYGTTTNFGLTSVTNVLPSSRTALRFDGVTQSVATAVSLNLSNVSFSIEAWVRRAGAGRDDLFLGQGTNGAVNRALHFGFRANNRFTFGFWNNDLDTPFTYTDTNWHHWAGTFDAPARMRRIYRDGVQVAQVSGPLPYEGTGLIALARSIANGNWFGGDLDEVRIWSGVRSVGDIAAGMNANAAGTEPNLLACWRMDEGIGTFTADSAPSANHGTLINSPQWIAPSLAPDTAIAGLQPGTTYYFRMVGTSDAGTGAGAIMTFTTAPAAPVVTTLAPTLIGFTNATFNGSVNPNGTNTAVYFEYGPTTAYGSATMPMAIGATNVVLPFATAATGLLPGGVYYYRAVASNDVGVVYGGSAVFITQPLPPVATTLPPFNVSVSNATLNGSVNRNGAATRYYFEYGGTTNYGASTDTNTLPPGRFALRFQGPHYGAVGSQINLSNVSFTVEAWMRRARTNFWDIVLQHYGGTVNNRSLHFGFRPDNRFTFAFFNNDLNTTNYYADTNWHHWAGTFDANTRVRNLYLDGQLVASDIAPTVYQGVDYFELARTVPNGGDIFRGDIDEIRLWITARSASQIQSNMNVILQGNESGLRCYWRMDEGGGGNISDVSGNGEDGVVYNSPQWFTPSPLLPRIDVLAATTNHFRLVAFNTLGTSFGSNVSFVTPSAPAAVTTLEPSSVTPTNATFNASVNAHGSGGVVYFQYGVAPGLSTNTAPLLLPSTNVPLPFETLVNLSPGVTYSYRAVGSNSHGFTFGNTVTFTTPLLPPIAFTKPATNIADFSATLQGVVVPNGAVASYWFEYGTTTNYGASTPMNATAPLGTALRFNGSNQSVTTTQALNLANRSFTVEAWARRAALNRYDLFLQQGSNGVANQSLHFGFRNNNTFTFAFWGSDLDTPVYTDTGWHHWAGTFDVATGIRTIYRDGVPIVGAFSGPYLGNDIINLASSPGIPSWFGGDLDEVRLWSGARSQSEIVAGMRTSALGTESNLLACWRFDEGSGAFTADASTNANGGQLVNQPTWLTLDNVAQNISNLLSGTTYHFRLVVTNGSSIAYGSNFSFTTHGPTVLTLPASDVTSTGAQFNALINPNNAEQTAFFNYGVSPLVSTSTVPVLLDATNDLLSFSATQTELLPGTPYLYRVIASNAATTVSGSNVIFVTSADAPAPITGTATNITSSAALLQGDANANGLRTRYFFEYGTNLSGGTTSATPVNLLPPSAKALRFNGTNDSVVTSASLNLSNVSFSVEGWIRRAAINRNDFAFQQNTNGIVYRSLHFGFRANNRFTFAFWGADLDSPGIYTDTNWHHWAGTFDAVSHERRIYRDGVLVATDFAPTYFGIGSINIAQSLGSGAYFGGDLDELRFWSGVRTPAEIAAGMNTNAIGNEPALLACWRFDEGVGSVTADHTATANHGTFAGAPMWIRPGTAPMLAGSLLANTTYDFRLVAMNDFGTNLGSVVSFTTDPAPPTIGALSATAISPTNATLNASVNPGGIDTTAFFEYGLTTNYGSTLAPVVLSGTTPQLIESTLADLLPDTQYRFRVTASNSVGLVFSTSASFHTLAIPPRSLTQPAFSVTATSAWVAGAVSPNGRLTRYFFEYGDSTNYGFNSVTNVLPPSGVALRFNGVNQSVTTTKPLNLANVSFTVEAWVRRATSNRVDLLLQHGSGAVMNQSLHFGFRANNAFTFAFWANDLDTPPIYTDTNWHHWAATFNATNRARQIFRDGVLVTNDVAPSAYQGAGTVVIARSPDNLSWFGGDLDEVRFWSGVRSQSQIIGGMNTNALGSEGGLVACWRMDEGIGNTTADVTTNAINGTLVNAPLWITPTVAQLISGLQPATTYNFRLVSMSTAGTGYGSNLTFNTSAGAPSVVTLLPDPIDATNATFNATVDPNGAATRVYFQYGITTNYGSVTASELISATNISVPFSTNVGGLNRNAIYNVRAVASNSFGVVFGSNITFTTTLAPPIATTQPAIGIATSSATLRGAVDSLGQGTRYWFQFGTTTNYGSQSAPQPLPPLNVGLRFNGIGQYVNTFQSLNLNNVSFTVEAWARRGSPNRLDLLIGQGSATPNAGLHFGFRPDNRFTFAFWGNDLDTTNTYTDAEWHHWAGTFDAVTRARRIYRDGILVASNTAPSVYQGNAPVTMAYSAANAAYFAGDMDDVRIWTSARSQPQITSTMNNELVGNETNLLAYWRFNEGSGSGTFDGSGRGNSGSLVNGPQWLTPSVSQFVSGLQTGSNYNFRLVAANNSGTNYGSNFTFVAAIPPTASIGIPPLSVTATSAAFMGGVNPNGAPTVAYFQFGTTPAFESSTAISNLPVASTFFTITGAAFALNPNTFYYYRLAASNAAGAVFTSAGTFITPGLPPVAMTLTAAGLTTNSATLRGSVNQNGSPTRYYYEYGTNTNYGFFTATNLLPPSGTALRFNGTNQSVATTQALNLVNRSFTIEAWARRAAPNRNDFLLQQGHTNVANASLHFGFRQNNAFAFAFMGNGLDTGSIYTDTNWHHWAGTFDAVTRGRAIFRDGVLVATNVAPSFYQGTGVINLAYSPGVPSWFGGDLDEVRFWSGVRSLPDIVAGMGTNALGTESNLLACWRLDEGSGSLAADVSTNANNGELVNTPTWLSFPDLPQTISNLQSGVTYHFRLVATNAGGISYGSNEAFTTVTHPSVTTLAATLIGTSNATLNALINPNSDATTVYFEYGTTTNYGLTTVPGMLEATNAALAFDTIVNDLTVSTLYHFRAVASNSAGIAFGEDLTFTTTNAIVPPSPQISAPSYIGPDVFEFTFTSLPGASFTVLASTNVALPVASWEVIGSANEVAPGSYQFTDSTATNGTRFYQLRSP